MLTMVNYVHERIKSYGQMPIGIDFTMGNGHDTEFLLSICDVVYAFDIQPSAIEETRKRVGNNAHLILSSHEYFDEYVEHFDVGIFNLGYLPCHEHTVKTQLSTTKKAIGKAILAMNKVLFIVCYPGHPEGKEEAEYIDQYVSLLDTHMYNVSKYSMLNKHHSPYVIEIEKR